MFEIPRATSCQIIRKTNKCRRILESIYTYLLLESFRSTSFKLLRVIGLRFSDGGMSKRKLYTHFGNHDHLYKSLVTIVILNYIWMCLYNFTSNVTHHNKLETSILLSTHYITHPKINLYFNKLIELNTIKNFINRLINMIAFQCTYGK